MKLDPDFLVKIDPWMFSRENRILSDRIPGVEVPIPQIMICAPAPGGGRVGARGVISCF
jgi:hypothetical protein